MFFAIRQLAATPRGPYVAVGAFEQTVGVWDIHERRELLRLQTVLGFGGSRLTLAPSGSVCVAAAYHRLGIAAYSVASGELLWERRDLRRVQTIRCSPSGESIFFQREGAASLTLQMSTGATVEKLLGIQDLYESPYSSAKVIGKRTLNLESGGILRGAVPRLSFALLAASFSPTAVCISEAAGPVRCFELDSADAVWQYQPPDGWHVTSLAYSQIPR